MAGLLGAGLLVSVLKLRRCSVLNFLKGICRAGTVTEPLGVLTLSREVKDAVLAGGDSPFLEREDGECYVLHDNTRVAKEGGIFVFSFYMGDVKVAHISVRADLDRGDTILLSDMSGAVKVRVG